MWARASAGVLPGFFFSAGLLGLLCWSLPGPWEATLAPGLVMFFPLWIGVICVAVALRSTRRAWLWLSLLALLTLGALRLLQMSGWVQ